MFHGEDIPFRVVLTARGHSFQDLFPAFEMMTNRLWISLWIDILFMKNNKNFVFLAIVAFPLTVLLFVIDGLLIGRASAIHFGVESDQ